jgi:DUF4097 and DUF4098 domain-containing protein YvlB
MKTTHLILCLAAFGAALSTAQASSAVDETRAMPANGLLQVENTAGSIEITAWDKAEVHITGQLGDDVEKFEILESAAGLQVKVHNRRNARSVDESHLRLSVPAGASVEAESVSADITVRGMQDASLVLNSVSGDLDIEAGTERLEVESVSGDVKFRGQAPRTSVETVSGEIDVQGIAGEIRLSTVSGDTELQGGEVDRARFETVSGDLRIELQVTAGGRLNAQSMSGDVQLTLPAAQQAEFTAQTYSGDIDSDFGAPGHDARGPGKTFSFREGGNGASIRIESFSGDISILKR